MMRAVVVCDIARIYLRGVKINSFNKIPVYCVRHCLPWFMRWSTWEGARCARVCDAFARFDITMLNAIMSTALVPDLARYTNVFCKIRFRYLHFLINYSPTFFIIYWQGKLIYYQLHTRKKVALKLWTLLYKNYLHSFAPYKMLTKILFNYRLFLYPCCFYSVIKKRTKTISKKQSLQRFMSESTMNMYVEIIPSLKKNC